MNDQKSETPRTDKFAQALRGLGTGYYQALDHARELERELTAAQQALSTANAMIENYRTGDAMLLELLPGHATIAEGIHALKKSLAESQQREAGLRKERDDSYNAIAIQAVAVNRLEEHLRDLVMIARPGYDPTDDEGASVESVVEDIKQALTAPPPSVVPWEVVNEATTKIQGVADALLCGCGERGCIACEQNDHYNELTQAIVDLMAYAPQPKEKQV